MKTMRNLLTVASLMLVASELSAQLPEAGTAGFSMSGNYTAVARGYEAVAWNPANLGFSSNPWFSINLATLGGTSGLDPVKFNDIADFGGKLIPSSTKDQWLQLIGSGSERGTLDGGVSVIALSIGKFGFQAGVVGTGDIKLNQDAAEALLYGNAGRTGTAKNFNFNGSSANGSTFGVGAASIAIPVMSGNHGEEFSIGVTGKYIAGIAAGRAMDVGSTVTTNNISVQFPSIFTDTNHYGNSGSGVGVDVGLAWTNGRTTFSAAARNVVNTFKWSPTAFSASLGTVTFDGTNNVSHFEDTTYTLAPASLRNALEAEQFKPEIAAGLAHHMGPLLITVDGHGRLGDGIEIGPKMHIGAGAEFTGIPLLALRAGAAAVSDGVRIAGGFGLQLGSYELGAGVSSRSKNGGQDLGFILSLLSIH